jgi:DNA-binding HxlR family transcriptional regulator
MQLTMLRKMERKSFEHMACSVAQCLEVVGEWWSMLLIRERLGISRNVLTQRLTKLVEAGVLEKQPYQDNPVRYEYLLTDKGRDLWPVLTSMRQWGDRHAAPSGPPMRVTHRACGHAARFDLHCSKCGERVGPRDVRAEPTRAAR